MDTKLCSIVENSTESELSASERGDISKVRISPAPLGDIIITGHDKKDFDLAETIDITPEKSRGVLKKIVKAGDGQVFPSYGDRVSVHHTGWLLLKEPKVFDTTRNDDNPVQFNLGRGIVIKGWDLGIGTMKKGEVSLFIIHPSYAYGIKGSSLPFIPPNTPLLFEIELVGWKLEDLSPKKNNSILRKILEKGEGKMLPNEGSNMKVKIIEYDDNNDKLYEEEKEFILGEGCIANIPEGIEIALQKFRLNERSTIILKNIYALDLQKKTELTSDDFTSELEKKYEVTLLSFEKVKNVWEMNSDEKFESAKVTKEKGVSFFQAGNYKVALKLFKRTVDCLEKEPGVSEDSQDERTCLLISGYLNVSLCFLKIGNFADAVKVCDKALNLDPKNEKALFRRGQAKVELNDCEEALEDFENLLKLNSANKAAQNYLTLCQRKCKEQKMKDKTTYNRMFEIFKERDEERLKNMKTETGVWQNGKKGKGRSRQRSISEDIITVNSSALLGASVIEISDNLNENINDIS